VAIYPDAQFVTALMMLGVGWAFVRADPDSATSRALASALALGGVFIVANVMTQSALAVGPLPPWARFVVIPEVLGFCAIFEWVHRVRSTIPASGMRTRFGDRALRVAQALMVLFGINGFRHPELHARDFFGGLGSSAIWSAEVVRLFLAPLGIAMLLWILAIVLCLRRHPEAAERIRLIAFLVAVPVMAVGMVSPPAMAPVTTVLGLCVALAGALKHAQLKGRQGQFMSRFLSPQVATVVNRDGLHAAMREQRYELSIVCVDLRGFTAYAGGNRSDVVLELLRDYYDVVGSAVAEFEGTVKDYAGDGVLILIGAPVASADHAPRAVGLAQRIREVVAPITTRYSSADGVLDSGIGVASGVLTVGIIGGEGRLEYAAVGQAVNVASRLCDHAAAGEILIAEETFHFLAGTDLAQQCVARPARMLKGFAAPVTNFALQPAA
jgi:adenylate cyclase